jgi:hypothetical protein
LADCPVRFDYYSTNRDRTANTDRSPKAPVPKALADGKPQPDQVKGAAGSKKTKLVNNDGLAESTRDQMPADQHEPSPSLA